MPIKVKCTCGRDLSAPDELEGKPFSCPGCQASLILPASTNAPTCAEKPPESATAHPKNGPPKLSKESKGGYKISSRKPIGQRSRSNPDRKPVLNKFDREKVLQEIERQASSKQSWLSNVAILAISLFVFYQIGLIGSSASDVAGIIIVLLIHELGHLLAMRIFGYKNLKVFFIPLFGAAVSGQSRNTPAWKKAVVSLMGPMPGILIGIGFLIARSFIADGEWCYQIGLLFIAINGFNLLPFYPLDGGRIVYEVLFSRNEYLELCFKLLAVLALVGLGLLLGAWVLAIFGFFSLLAVPISFRLAKIAREVRQTHLPKSEAGDALATGDPANEMTDDSIPGPVADDIIERVCKIPQKLSPKMAASHTKTVWELIQNRHPGFIATVLVLGLYLFALCLPVVGLVMGAAFSTNRTIVQYESQDGEIRHKEQLRRLNVLLRETELSGDGKLYHGKEVLYHPDGKVFVEGMWYEGKRDGNWSIHNQDEFIVLIAAFDRGKFLYLMEAEDGRLVKREWGDLDADQRGILKKQERSQPEGPENRGEGGELIDWY